MPGVGLLKLLFLNSTLISRRRKERKFSFFEFEKIIIGVVKEGGGAVHDSIRTVFLYFYSPWQYCTYCTVQYSTYCTVYCTYVKYSTVHYCPLYSTVYCSSTVLYRTYVYSTVLQYLYMVVCGDNLRRYVLPTERYTTGLGRDMYCTSR